jgi:hypothetical protein
MKVAQAKLMEIGPDDMNMEEYKVSVGLCFFLIPSKTLLLEASDS